MTLATSPLPNSIPVPSSGTLVPSGPLGQVLLPQPRPTHSLSLSFSAQKLEQEREAVEGDSEDPLLLAGKSPGCWKLPGHETSSWLLPSS